jgi:hypothetical protein
MPETIDERVCAEVDGGVVVFLIGMRINRFWKFWKWLPIVRAMPRMLNELDAHPELGMLSARAHFGLRNLVSVQYWQSVEHLQAFAHSLDKTHLPEWQAFNISIGSSGDVGIWHETFVVPRGHYESVYVNMPRYGLGLRGAIHPATGSRASASKRLAGMRSEPVSPADEG